MRLNGKWTPIIVAATSAVLCFAGAAQADFTFTNITHNGNADLSGQLDMNVTGSGNQAVFTFTNHIGIASSICDVYFADGTLLGIAKIEGSTGVKFSQYASPGNLPGGNGIGFVTTQGFSADSDAPVEKNGVNKATEWLKITFNLLPGKTYEDTIQALNTGALLVGMHVQGIGTGGGSDSYIARSAVPAPGAALLACLGLGFVGWFKRRFA